MGEEKRGENLCSRETPFSKGTGDQEERIRHGNSKTPRRPFPFNLPGLPLRTAAHANFVRLIPKPLLHRVLVTVASFLPFLLIRPTFLRIKKQTNKQILLCKAVMYC